MVVVKMRWWWMVVAGTRLLKVVAVAGHAVGTVVRAQVYVAVCACLWLSVAVCSSL